MDFVTQLLVQFGFFFLVGYVMLFGKTKGNRGTIVEKAHDMVLVVPRSLGKCCSGALPSWCWAPCRWAVNTRNPLLQIAFLSLLWGLFYVFYTNAVVRFIPSPGVSVLHRYAAYAVVAINFVAFVLCSVVQPGKVTEENSGRLRGMYSQDDHLFFDGDCETCKTHKPPRSKHCSLCDACVVRCDHHCFWVNACVGLHNHRWFLLWLATLFVICTYGCYLLFLTMASFVRQHRLWEAEVLLHDGSVEAMTWSHLLKHLVRVETGNVGLFIFLFLLQFLVGSFLGQHLYLVATNQTVNEYSKRKYMERPSKNLYNKGMVQNFLEVLFPRKL